VASEYDNYEQHNQSLTIGDNKNVVRDTPRNFGAFGTGRPGAARRGAVGILRAPFAGEALRRPDHFRHRANSSDERERALDRSKINYDDRPSAIWMKAPATNASTSRSFCVQDAGPVRTLTRGLKGWLLDRMWRPSTAASSKGPTQTGKEIRTERWSSALLRNMDEERKPVMSQVAIKERRSSFTQEASTSTRAASKSRRYRNSTNK